MNYKYTLSATSASKKALLKYINSYFYLVVGADQFGKDVSVENAAIFKLGSTFDPVDSCYGFVAQSTDIVNMAHTQTTVLGTSGVDYIYSHYNYTLTDVTGNFVNEDKFATEPFYFKADESRQDSSSTNCTLQLPYISNGWTTQTIYATKDVGDTWEIQTVNPNFIPFTISLFVDGDNSSLPVFLSLDDSVYDSTGKMIYVFNMTKLGVWYELGFDYVYDWKVFLIITFSF